mmetsp:Transcript_82263/g.158918  ORF Transcript_82263/g.158918 Transcript_82263/m.158918 type:complete len:322 (-) Transcript_82263:117-1082(-)
MFWGTPKRNAAPLLGTIPVDLVLPGAEQAESESARVSPLADGVQGLLGRSDHCDIVFTVARERFPAHGPVLAAASATFREFLMGSSGGSSPSDRAGDPMQGLLVVAPRPAATGTTSPPAEEISGGIGDSSPPPVNIADASTPKRQRPQILELHVKGIETSEALETLLAFVYMAGTGGRWVYAPTSDLVNKDVLMLARHFGMPRLHEHAARWLVKDLTTANVVDRLATCEEFGLGLLHDKIVEQLTANPAELTVVSTSPELMRHPRILQDLLVQVAMLAGNSQQQQQQKQQQRKGNSSVGNASASQPVSAKRARQGNTAAKV